MNIYDIELAHRQKGGHWFDPEAKRFFRSRVSDIVYEGPGGVYFVSSEQFQGSNGYRKERKFTVRQFDPNTGSVETIGEFNQLSRSTAHAKAKRMAKGGK